MCFIFYIYFVQEYGLVQKTAGLSFETSDSAIVVTLGTLLLTKLVCSCSSDISFFFFFLRSCSLGRLGSEGPGKTLGLVRGPTTYLVVHIYICRYQVYRYICRSCIYVDLYLHIKCRYVDYMYMYMQYMSTYLMTYLETFRNNIDQKVKF